MFLIVTTSVFAMALLRRVCLVEVTARSVAHAAVASSSHSDCRISIEIDVGLPRLARLGPAEHVEGQRAIERGVQMSRRDRQGAVGFSECALGIRRPPLTRCRSSNAADRSEWMIRIVRRLIAAAPGRRHR